MRHMTPWPKHAGRAGLGRARRDAPCLPQPRTRRWHGVATAGRLPGLANRLRRNYFRRNLLAIAARSRLDITYDLAIRAEETSDMPLRNEFRTHGRARTGAFGVGLCIVAASIAAWPAIARAAS